MSKAIGIACITLLISFLCFFVGFLAWGPNMDASYTATGYLGVLMPIMAVLAAFIFGLGTGLSVDPEDKPVIGF